MIANVIVSSSPTSGIFFSVKNLEKFSKYSTCTSFESESDPEKKNQTMRKYNHSENIRLYSNI